VLTHIHTSVKHILQVATASSSLLLLPVLLLPLVIITTMLLFCLVAYMINFMTCPSTVVTTATITTTPTHANTSSTVLSAFSYDALVLQQSCYIVQMRCSRPHIYAAHVLH